MSEDYISDYVRAAAERSGIKLPPCADCNGLTYVHMLDQEFPCPSCQPRMFEEKCRKMGISTADYPDAGAGAVK